MKNQLSDLNNYLFEALEDIVNPEIDNETGTEKEFDLNKVKAITSISNQILEVEKLKVKKVQILLKNGYELNQRGDLMAPFVEDSQKLISNYVKSNKENES